MLIGLLLLAVFAGAGMSRAQTGVGSTEPLKVAAGWRVSLGGAPRPLHRLHGGGPPGLSPSSHDYSFLLLTAAMRG